MQSNRSCNIILGLFAIIIGASWQNIALAQSSSDEANVPAGAIEFSSGFEDAMPLAGGDVGAEDDVNPASKTDEKMDEPEAVVGVQKNNFTPAKIVENGTNEPDKGMGIDAVDDVKIQREFNQFATKDDLDEIFSDFLNLLDQIETTRKTQNRLTDRVQKLENGALSSQNNGSTNNSSQLAFGDRLKKLEDQIRLLESRLSTNGTSPQKNITNPSNTTEPYSFLGGNNKLVTWGFQSAKSEHLDSMLDGKLCQKVGQWLAGSPYIERMLRFEFFTRYKGRVTRCSNRGSSWSLYHASESHNAYIIVENN